MAEVTVSLLTRPVSYFNGQEVREMPNNGRPYEPPEVVTYGRLVALTKGLPDGFSCPDGQVPGKLVGAGDDFAEQELSAFVCVTP